MADWHFCSGTFGLGGFSNPIGGGGGTVEPPGTTGNGENPQQDGQGTVKIIARNPRGQSVDNVSITLESQDKEGSSPTHTATTDNNGVVTFTNLLPGIYQIKQNDTVVAVISIHAQQTIEQTIIINNLVQVQITITDNKTLKGVPNYTFRIYLGSGERQLLATATTNNSGQASVNLPANQNVNITSNLSSATLQNFTVPSDNGRNITVFISQAAQPGQTLALHYRFVNSEGKFAQGKRVTILSVGDSSTSSDDKILVTTTVPSDGLVTVTGLKPGDRLLVEYEGQKICGVTVPNQNAAQAGCTLPD